MDSSDKLYFDKILTSLDGISSSLEGGGDGTPETGMGLISAGITGWYVVYFNDANGPTKLNINANNIEVSIQKNSYLCIDLQTNGLLSMSGDVELLTTTCEKGSLGYSGKGMYLLQVSGDFRLLFGSVSP